MKKIFLPLLLAIVLSLTACSQEKAPGTQADEAGISLLKADAEALADNLIKENYAAASADFDATMKKVLTEDGLKTEWVKTVSNIGEYKNLVSAEYTYEEGYNIVTVQAAFESSAVNIRVVYGADDKVAGLRFTYAPLPDEAKSDAYTENSVTVAGNPDLPLDGILTLPNDVEKPPVVILVQGSGQSDKDETYQANRPFADIAHGLAEKGIATLRYDKRYYTYAQNAPGVITLKDEILDDVNAAIKLMRENQKVDSQRIYVLGHSLGGSLTPAIATQNSDLAGIISMAGTLRPLYESSYDQNQEVIKNLDRTTLTKEQNTQLDQQIAIVEADIITLRGDLSNVDDSTVLMGLPAGYQKSLKEYSGLNYIEKVSCPILVLQGSADFQVYPETDFELWKEKLTGRNDVTFQLYEGLNHLMMTTNGKRDITEYDIPGKVAQQVIDDIASFAK